MNTLSTNFALLEPIKERYSQKQGSFDSIIKTWTDYKYYLIELHIKPAVKVSKAHSAGTLHIMDL